MKNKPTDFAYHLTNFLAKYLPGQQGRGTNTIKSYRDSFTLYLKYCRDECGIKPEAVTLSTITAESVRAFLAWLENARDCSVSTRNQRLAAFHSFFGYLQTECADYLLLCQKILYKHRYVKHNIKGFRIKRGTFTDTDHYGIILARNPKGHYVTWQFHLDENDEPKVYWGHYFMENRDGAVRDFTSRDLPDAPSEINNEYWDCNCIKHYIHPLSDKICPLCGAERDKCPDSLQKEVEEGNHFFVS